MTEERLVRVALSRSNQHGSSTLLRRLASDGPDTALDLAVGEHRPEALAQAEADLEVLTALGGRIVIPSDPEWPPRLADLDAADGVLDAPPALWVRGDAHLAEALDRSIAVVGSRAFTPHGQHNAHELAGGIAAAGWTIVSGAAYGIDGFAHQAALRAGGMTVAIMACGVDVAYPERHRDLLRRILAGGGLVVSEVPCGVRPARWRFLARNRLIAAVTRGTVLVEAGLRSGALNTVGHAHALSRQVCVLPGPVGPASTAGCQTELRTGRSTAVFSAQHVLTDIGPVGESLDAPVLLPMGPRDGLSSAQGALLELLPAKGAMPVAELLSLSGVPFRQLVRDLGTLEQVGLAVHAEGLVRLTARGRAPSGVASRDTPG